MRSRFLKNERGAAMVEFAFVAPAVITLVMLGSILAISNICARSLAGASNPSHVRRRSDQV
jgi:Flp pilus assembly pilin Flp